MSGTAYGTVALHISPEAAVGGPLNLVRHGDSIGFSLDGRRIDLLISSRQCQTRRASPPRRGYDRLYCEHVQQAHLGCDFDFLRHDSLNN